MRHNMPSRHYSGYPQESPFMGGVPVAFPPPPPPPAGHPYRDDWEGTPGEEDLVEARDVAVFSELEEAAQMNARVLKFDDVYDDEKGRRTLVPYDPERGKDDTEIAEAPASTIHCDSCVLLVRRIFDRASPDDVKQTVLDLRSHLIRQVVMDCVPMEKANLTTGSTLIWPHEEIFRYRHKIKETAEKDHDLTQLHVAVLLDLIDSEFATKISEINSKFPKGVATFDIVREAFMPGEIIMQKRDGKILCYRVFAAKYMQPVAPPGDDRKFMRSLSISAHSIASDGKSLGSSFMSFVIPEFKGAMFLTNLDVFPLRAHPDAEEIVQTLIQRGRKLVSLQGQHFKHFKGTAMRMQGHSGTQTMDSRVVIDIGHYNESRPHGVDRSTPESRAGLTYRHASNLINYLSEETMESLKTVDEDGVAPVDLLLCTPEVPVFCLSDKEWYRGNVTNVQEIEFNEELMAQLVLSENTKRLARVMVQKHIDGTGFDDFVKGKGKGLVMLFHGPPGVGKTMMAEAMAEHLKRPLYAITSGELGTEPDDLESRLQTILDRAHAFNAVLLLDEADVFLARRAPSDLARNALVSIFLRLLEYHPGILILTSNRAAAFDDAFHSRIHVTFAFHPLGQQSRESVWRNFAKQRDANMTEEDFAALAAHPLNGRQIKNTFGASAALAADEGVPISVQHIQAVLDVLLSSSFISSQDGNDSDGCILY